MMDQLSNYDKYPVVKVSGCTDGCWQGWEDIGVEINRYISGYTKPVKKWSSNVIRVYWTKNSWKPLVLL